MFEFADTTGQQAVIKVIGVGGGGGNAVEHMLKANIDGVGFINANTDAQTLSRSQAPTLLQIGESLTRGLGAGADPEVGRQAAVEDRARIAESLQGADMVFIAAGMGGGTGTGAAPVIAELVRESKALTVAVVTKPFPFEGRQRMQLAERGMAELEKYVDSLITIPNEKLLQVIGHQAKMVDAFDKANEVLCNAVRGISELITRPGLINVDFADVQTVMSEMGTAMMGSGVASGESRAQEATKSAISSPLLEGIDLHGAKGMLVNITASPSNMQIGELEEVGKAIEEYTMPDAKLVIGTALDEAMGDDLRVTVVATGLSATSEESSAEHASVGDVAGVAVAVGAGVGAGVGAATEARPVHPPLKAVPGRREAPRPSLWGRAARATSAKLGTGITASTGTDDPYANSDLPAFLRKQAD